MSAYGIQLRAPACIPCPCADAESTLCIPHALACMRQPTEMSDCLTFNEFACAYRSGIFPGLSRPHKRQESLIELEPVPAAV